MSWIEIAIVFLVSAALGTVICHLDTQTIKALQEMPPAIPPAETTRRKSMKDEQAIEAEIQRKGLNAPRLKPSDIDLAIAGKLYHVFPGTTLTICCLILRNGFTVTGESAAASRENFDEEIGRNIAFENARNKIWALEGYRLKQFLFEQSQADADTSLMFGHP